MFRSSAIFLILIVTLTNSTLLPYYFEKCSLSNSKLNKCLTKNAIEAWPNIIQGDKNVHLQTLDPLNITFVNAVVNNNLVGNLTNALVTGLADIKFDEIKLDQDKQIFDIYFLIPRLNIWGLYDIKGEIINLQLEGQGTVNDTFNNFSSHFQIEYELIEKHDKHYINPVKNSMVYNTTSIEFQMENLGEMVNRILNDNWELVNKEISQSFGNVIGELFIEVLKPFFKKVSYEELFSN